MVSTEISAVNTSRYTHPEVLVDSEWVVQRMNDFNVRSIEANENILLYETGHIRNAVKLDWHSDVPASPDGAHPEGMWTLTTPGGFEL
jgi:thiosulfate/3-mercaptopyruvate sulfurtransferase